MDSQNNSEVKEDPSQKLSEAKARLIAEAGKIDYLAPLRKHPWATVGSAAALGAAFGSVGALMRDPKRGVKPQPGQHLDDDDKNISSATHSIAASALQHLMPVLQPLLVRGAKLAADWWTARHQPPATAAAPAETVDRQAQPSTETV